jgi:hypothetical protein
MLGLWVQLDELVQVSSERFELQVSDLKNVGATVTQESRVVRHHNAGDVFERVDIVLDPLDVNDIPDGLEERNTYK